MDFNLIRTYYRLTKPGIIYGNLIALIAGFIFAAGFDFNIVLFITTILGSILVMASGCVFNNILDIRIDSKMKRTQNRALVKGTISVKSALIYGTILGLLGSAILFKFTNILTLSIALIGLFSYVVLYGIAKRGTQYSTIVGSISGAAPPVVGYTAVTGRIDLGAILLFLILVTWQMPHFYAISIFRQKDYAAANIPVLSIVKGIRHTKIQMISYVISFIVAVSLLFLSGYAGLIYLVVMITVSFIWLSRAFEGFNTNDNEKWARGMFRFSLIVLLSFCITISITPFLPL